MLANDKRNARRRVQKEIRQHMQDPEFYDAHDRISADAVLPRPRDLYVPHDPSLVDNSPVDLAPVDEDGNDILDILNADDVHLMSNGKDVRRLVVGRVPIHQRINMKPISVGDIVCLTFTDADDMEQVGVAQVVDDPREDEKRPDMNIGPNTVYIHWWETHAANAMTGAFLPVFSKYQNGTMYKAKKKSDERDGRWLDTMDNKTVIQYGEILTSGVRRKKAKGKPKRGKSIKLNVRRRACWLEGIKWKIKDHGDHCECMN